VKNRNSRGAFPARGYEIQGLLNKSRPVVKAINFRSKCPYFQRRRLRRFSRLAWRSCGQERNWPELSRLTKSGAAPRMRHRTVRGTDSAEASGFLFSGRVVIGPGHVWNVRARISHRRTLVGPQKNTDGTLYIGNFPVRKEYSCPTPRANNYWINAPFRNATVRSLPPTTSYVPRLLHKATGRPFSLPVRRSRISTDASFSPIICRLFPRLRYFSAMESSAAMVEAFHRCEACMSMMMCCGSVA
jgi:hypothetical protein